MVLKIKQGGKLYVLAVGGATKDGIDCYKLVGDKQTPKCSFGIGVGKNEDGTSQFENVNAWRKLAEIARSIKKGDTVMVWGSHESHEYNGKIYEGINAEWVSVAGFDGMSAILGAASSSGTTISIANDDFIEISEDEKPLPF